MKASITRLIAFVLLGLTFVSCSSKSEEPQPLEIGDLKQTVWEGLSYQLGDGEQWYKTDVTLHFYDDSRVQVRINDHSYAYDCAYTVDKRVLRITHKNLRWPIGNDFWYISKRTKDDLYFETPPGDPRGVYHLELHRKL